MQSPMHPLTASSQTITIEIPPGLAPITCAFLIALDGTDVKQQQQQQQGKKKKRRQFAIPLEGRHFSALLGMSPGAPTPLGPSIVPPNTTTTTDQAGKKKGLSTVNFAVSSRGGTNVSLVLMHPPATTSSAAGQWTSVEFTLDPVLNRTGDTWHVAVPNLKDVGSLCYGWRIDGDVSWESGYRVQPDAVMLDPYAPGLVYLPVGDTRPSPPLPVPTLDAGVGGGRVYALSAITGVDSSSLDTGKEGTSQPLYRALEDGRGVLEIDVRTFTATTTTTTNKKEVQHPGTFLGVIDRIDHIKAIGVNTVVLYPPCYATAAASATAHPHAAVSFMAPDPALSTDPTSPALAGEEFKAMVHALHAAGIEVIPSIDLTFTADGIDAHPNAVSLRGLDHASYFRPNGVINCGHPVVHNLVRTALHRWTAQFGVDGFCFIHAENMTQDAGGLVQDAPTLPDALCQDPRLAGLKLVAAPTNDGLLPRGGARGFPHWGVWQQRNQGFAKDIIALMVEASHTAIDGVANRLSGSASVFGGWGGGEDMPGNLAVGRRPSFSYNAATYIGGGSGSHHSVMDIARDASGMAGAAVMASGGGPVPSAKTIAKTILLAVLFSRGTPVICQDDVADVEMAHFVGVVSRLRRKLAYLLLPPRFDSPRDIAWYNAHGGEPEWVGGGSVGEDGVPLPPPPPPAYGGSYLAFSIRHPDGSAVYVGFNPYPTQVAATLPAPPAGHTWLRAVDTAQAPPDDAALREFVAVSGGQYIVNGKSSIVLIAGIVEKK